MTLAAALVLLLSCSHAFQPTWEWDENVWRYGAERARVTWVAGDEGSVLQGQQQSSATDLLFTFPRPLTRAERPFIQFQVKIPDVSSLPVNYNGNTTYLACRVSEVRDQNNGLLWPGCFFGRSGESPCLFTRVLSGLDFATLLSGDGWWTIGLGWDAEGRISFYAASGKTDLTQADFIATDPNFFPVIMQTVNGLYLDVASVPGLSEQPVWVIGRIDVFADVRPNLTISYANTSQILDQNTSAVVASGSLSNVALTVSGFPTEQYTLQRSLDLTQFDSILVVRDGDTYAEPITSEQMFWRLTTP